MKEGEPRADIVGEDIDADLAVLRLGLSRPKIKYAFKIYTYIHTILL